MLSLYDISVPVFIRALRNLDAILDKGAAFFAEQGNAKFLHCTCCFAGGDG